MPDKFSKDDIIEIASKLNWKPNNLSYNILYLVIALSILYIMIMIYLCMQYCSLKKKFKFIFEKFDKLDYIDYNIVNHMSSNFSNFDNNLRYLTQRSERNVKNTSLMERTDPNMPIFENEKENLKLFSALRGD